MARKNSTRKERRKEPRKKDCFDRWNDPKDAAVARENFLRYCKNLEYAYANICVLIRDLERAARQLPTHQAVVLPILSQDSVYAALDDHMGLTTTNLVEELIPITSEVLKAVPEALQAARKLESKLFNFGEHLGGIFSDSKPSKGKVTRCETSCSNTLASGIHLGIFRVSPVTRQHRPA